MKINYSKAYTALSYQEKLPRKVKKKMLGLQLSTKDLKQLLSSVKVIPPNNGHDSAKILPYPFCPKCGCKQVRVVDHRVEYPERWVSVYCARCSFLVEQSDNSPFYHALEFPEYGYKLN